MKDHLFSIQIWTDSGRWLVSLRSGSGIVFRGGPYATVKQALEGLERMISHAMERN